MSVYLLHCQILNHGFGSAAEVPVNDLTGKTWEIERAPGRPYFGLFGKFSG
jgi:hypothetical protein